MPSVCVRETILEKHAFYLIFYLQTSHMKILNFNFSSFSKRINRTMHNNNSSFVHAVIPKFDGHYDH